MNITDLREEDKIAFERFKEIEWKKADDEHYGDKPPSFDVLTKTFLAKDQKNVIGQIEVKINQGVAKIESLLVGSDSQGRGVGGELVRVAEGWVTENGAHKITLETGKAWKARNFYEKLGYEVRSILPNDVAHQDFVLMDKMLN